MVEGLRLVVSCCIIVLLIFGSQGRWSNLGPMYFCLKLIWLVKLALLLRLYRIHTMRFINRVGRLIEITSFLTIGVLWSFSLIVFKPQEFRLVLTKLDSLTLLWVMN